MNEDKNKLMKPVALKINFVEMEEIEILRIYKKSGNYYYKIGEDTNIFEVLGAVEEFVLPRIREGGNL